MASSRSLNEIAPDRDRNAAAGQNFSRGSESCRPWMKSGPSLRQATCPTAERVRVVSLSLQIDD